MSIQCLVIVNKRLFHVKKTKAWSLEHVLDFRGCDETPFTKAARRGKGLFHFTLPPFGKSGEELRAREGAVLSLLAQSAFTHTLVHLPRNGTAHKWSGSLPHQSFQKRKEKKRKRVHNLPTGQSDGGISSIDIPFSWVALACIEVMKRLTRRIGFWIGVCFHLSGINNQKQSHGSVLW